MSVAGLKKMMHIWKSRNITDSTTTKLLELYLGLTAYMNSQKIYPQENFYEIRNSLRFSTTQALIEAMKRSQAFPFVTDPETGAVKAFGPPLYHETNSEIRTEKDNGLSSQTFAQTFAQTFVATDNNNNINNNIYINSTNKRTSERSSSPEKDSPKDDSGNLSEENFPGQGNFTTDTLPTIAAKEFFHRINTSKGEKAGILIPLIDRFQEQEGIERPGMPDIGLPDGRETHPLLHRTSEVPEIKPYRQVGVAGQRNVLLLLRRMRIFTPLCVTIHDGLRDYSRKVT